MKALLVFLLALSGCATFTHRNINIYDRQRPPIAITETRLVVENMIGAFGFEQNRVAIIETKTKVLIDYVISKLGHEELFEGYDFVFISNWVNQSTSDEVAVGDGLTDLDNKVIYLMVRDCFADSAILHEMSHVIHADKRGNGDQNHIDKVWWSVMKIMSDNMIKHYCPLDYVRHDIPPTLIQN